MRRIKFSDDSIASKNVGASLAAAMFGGIVAILVGVAIFVMLSNAGDNLPMPDQRVSVFLFVRLFAIVPIGAGIYFIVFAIRGFRSKNRNALIDIEDIKEESDFKNEKHECEKKSEENSETKSSPEAVEAYCPYCGKPIKGDFEFCPKCGKKLPD